MCNKFEVGDTVTLKRGCSSMVVETVHDSTQLRNVGEYEYTCVWFNAAREIESYTFKESMLQLKGEKQ